MTRLPMRHDPHLDTQRDAQLLCDVCQLQPWTTRARWCAALICADCAMGEPDPEGTTGEAPPLPICPQCHAPYSDELRACMRCHGPTDCLCCDCDIPALITLESYL